MLRTIVIILIAVIVLSFFGVSIRAIVESPVGQDNLSFLWQIVLSLWEFLVDSWHAFTGWLEGIFRPIPFPR